MLSSARGESSRAQDLELLPPSESSGAGAAVDEKMAASSSAAGAAPGSRNSRDKIRCLDGLRGVACLLVFNYHFFWPWTPAIMLGHGAAPPAALEPYYGWAQLPIICLLHRGRPMVAIFFAISGYVLCRHILRAIHERRLEAAYKSLASAAFRRVFRLYIPPTISMLIVAVLAQMGAFKAEDDIFKGPDSVYINGTFAKVKLGGPCSNVSVPLAGAQGIADYMMLDDSTFLSNITGWDRMLCLNTTSNSYGPANTYKLVDKAEEQLHRFWNHTKGLDTWAVQDYIDQGFNVEHEYPYQGPIPINIKPKNATNATNFLFVQMGGSWEEHPLIHDNITYAAQNFTRVYAEWANPFNFGHYHPRYDPHTFTIPMELRGSMVVYIFLLATAALKAKWRLAFAGVLVAYSLGISRWDMATFLGGTTLSELDIRNPPDGQKDPLDDRGLGLPAASRRHRQVGPPTRRETILRRAGIVLALYLLSYPDAAAEYTPGFKFLSTWVPRYYHPLSGWMFYQSMGALLLLPCILRDPYLRGLLEGRVAQYLGRISFSLYLVHGPVLHCLGFWIMPRLFEHFGRQAGYLIGWTFMLSLTLYLSNLWYKKVDMWSVTVGRRIERHVVE
ncbi:hypothetical protein ACRE_016850 [Hapsidospora chrysogenum ATCC 11550]|uniref:Acyltransferase 3 domain-containing protein n=1 Tax=Hapsidospora chrysogenum (strain ATCC 11550 / CBS 779.69 / DSM 880 / IAM 14645 / JCM 23072 / IMI 49137) TaxID=857340 RepID=A0A086TDV1_HAPC1|nr:hypothetical protein ACRE_016850 [Hapsidospora chrysogenum ATCC 11550]